MQHRLQRRYVVNVTLRLRKRRQKVTKMCFRSFNIRSPRIKATVTNGDRSARQKKQVYRKTFAVSFFFTSLPTGNTDRYATAKRELLKDTVRLAGRQLGRFPRLDEFVLFLDSDLSWNTTALMNSVTCAVDISPRAMLTSVRL